MDDTLSLLSVAVYFHPQAHNDLLKTSVAKLQAFGIPVEELGFKPLESSSGQSLGQSPAALVYASN